MEDDSTLSDNELKEQEQFEQNINNLIDAKIEAYLHANFKKFLDSHKENVPPQTINNQLTKRKYFKAPRLIDTTNQPSNEKGGFTTLTTNQINDSFNAKGLGLSDTTYKRNK